MAEKSESSVVDAGVSASVESGTSDPSGKDTAANTSKLKSKADPSDLSGVEEGDCSTTFAILALHSVIAFDV